ncbi:MAG: hypothetical protein WCJ45_00960 [bacterium]
MKNTLSKLILFVIGIAICVFSSSNFLIFLGVVFTIAPFIWEFMDWKIAIEKRKLLELYANSSTSTGTRARQQQPVSDDSAARDKALKWKYTLDEEAVRLSKEAETTIMASRDVQYQCIISVNADERDYLCKQVICRQFGESVWDIKQRIDTFITLTDDQIILLLNYGSDRFIQRFSDKAIQHDWKMSDYIFDQLNSNRQLILLKLPYYSAECFQKLIVAADAYTLSGYRITPTSTDEQPVSTFINYLYDKTISYYEYVDTDVLTLAETHFPDALDLRKTAFDKLFAHCDLMEVIERLDEITEYEARKILERGIKEDVNAIFNRDDSDDYLNYLSPTYVIKAVLGIVESEWMGYFKDNFEFDHIPKDNLIVILDSLTADELANTNENGECDIIELFESALEIHPDYDELRKLAFAKLFTLTDLSASIERCERITQYEANTIIERNNENELEALFTRDDADEFIGKFPDAFIIKVHLGLWESSIDTDIFDDEYQDRMEDEAFKAKVTAMLATLQ